LDSPILSRYRKLGELESTCIAFFDLVDSTLLKQKLGQSQGVNLAVTHNRLAAEICQQFKGRVIKHIGDSIMVAFNTPLEGLLAALEFIRTLHRDKITFRTKAGLTHGTVTRVNINGLDYLGQAVDRSARLTALALPNQILTDENTMDMINTFLGEFDGVISRFLGVQELKGIGKVPVYEAAIEEMGFIEREPEIREVRLESPDPVKSDPLPPPPPGARLQLPPLAVPKPPASPVPDAILGKILEYRTPGVTDLDSVAVGLQNLNHLFEKTYDLHVRQIALGGSFARGTMVRPLSTVDLIAVLAPPPGQQLEVAETLARLKRHLSQGYSDSVTIQSERRVVISLQGLEFAVMPVMAVIENGKGQLMTPSLTGGFWVPRNPAAPEQWMDQAVKRNGPAFQPFLRLVRAWQRTNCNYMVNSYHLELLTDLIASKTTLELSFESVYQWFWHAYHLFSQNKKPFIRDPGQPKTYIDDYLYGNALSFNRFSRILTGSYSQAKHGLACHKAGDQITATARWQELFGPYLE